MCVNIQVLVVYVLGALEVARPTQMSAELLLGVRWWYGSRDAAGLST